jgi:hypothetical protein
MNSAIRSIIRERDSQDYKWGIQNHSLAEWLIILAEEFGEASKEINEFHFRRGVVADIRAELVQTAAVAVAMIEYIDRHKDSELRENE